MELVTNPAVRSGPPREVPVRIELGAAFELIATVWASLHESHHPYYDLGRSWFDDIASSAPDAIGRARAFAGGSMMVWDHVIGLALDGGAPFDVAALRQHVAGLDAGALRLDLLGRRNRAVQRTVGPERIHEAAEGSAPARRAFLRLAWPDDARWQAGLRQLLYADPEETRTALLELLAAWDEQVFAGYLPQVLPALEADAATRRSLAKTKAGLEVVRGAIDTSYQPTGDVVGIVLIPSFVIRPYVSYIEHADQMVFLYPVADRSAESAGMGPPGRLVKLAQALGDRCRLEILGALRTQDMTVKQLGAELGLPRSTLRHHLGILQAAGLLRPVQTGNGFSALRLREEAVSDLADLLERFLRS